ncbi:hypothetical protein B0H14DRAFT_2668960 [Mycena olivaceomarginata]|nr:hypothetical protein B0H14DRAFT_2668960 [Mycena olivaceomarginata]
MLTSLLRSSRRLPHASLRRFATTTGTAAEPPNGPVDVTDPRFLHDALESKPQVVYLGIDPTARSLHVGHLLPLMCLLHFHVRGHHVIPLSASWLIRKQPSGNTVALVNSRALVYADDRILLAADRMIDIRAKNNIAWHRDMTIMDFLRTLLTPQPSVRTRLQSNAGMSFTEFTYQLLQATFKCSLQVGGSDQWGNILAGISLIDRIERSEAHAPNDLESTAPSNAPPRAYGLTTPLLTTATGVKFGKTAGNAVWLDPQLTSVFNFYQYFVRTSDAEVESYLKLFTLLSWTEINETMESHRLQPEQRIAQRRLASELTELIHLKSGRVNAETMTKIMFETELAQVTAADVLTAFAGDRCVHMVDPEELTTVPVVRLAVKYGLAPSASAARVLVLSRGLYYNNRPVPEIQFTLRQMHLLNEELVILKAGKDKIAVLVAKKPEAN